MALFIIANSGKVSYGIKQYLCDTIDDIPYEDNGEAIAPGSTVYVVDSKKTYMYNSKGQWVEIITGGGDNTKPTFSSTTLYDSEGDYSSVASMTLSEDYHNFDFLKFTIYRDISSTPTYAGEFIISPTAIDEIYTNKGLYINFFPLFNPTNYGLCISPSDNTTFVRRWYREIVCTKIEGLSCTNKTVTATVLSLVYSAVNIFTLSDDVRNYDYLTVQSAGSADECGFSLMRMDDIFQDDEVILHAPTYMCTSRTTAMAGSIDGINFTKYYGNAIAAVVGYKFT